MEATHLSFQIMCADADIIGEKGHQTSFHSPLIIYNDSLSKKISHHKRSLELPPPLRNSKHYVLLNLEE